MKTKLMLGLLSAVLAGLLSASNASGQIIPMTPEKVRENRDALRQLNWPKTCFTLGLGSAANRGAFVRNHGGDHLGLGSYQWIIGDSGPQSDILTIQVESGFADIAERDARQGIQNMRSELCQLGFASIVFVATEASDYAKPASVSRQMTNPHYYWIARITPQGIGFLDKDIIQTKGPLKDENSVDAFKFVALFTLAP